MATFTIQPGPKAFYSAEFIRDVKFIPGIGAARAAQIFNSKAPFVINIPDDKLETATRNLRRLAYVLTHAAFFRRIAFAVKESTPGISELLNMNAYGLSRSPTPAQVDRSQIILPGVNMVKPGAKELKTPKAALEHIGPMIEEQLRNAGMAPPPLAFGGKEK